MGFADVGADVYIALGLITLFAGSAAPLAFLLAAITYVATGLCYAELASTYPVAGGAQYYSLNAFGRTHGFLAGWGLMLDYTIDIALFGIAAVGYVGALARLVGTGEQLLVSPYYGLAAVVVILSLIILNIIGIRFSSKLNEILVAIGLTTFAIILSVALPFVVSSGGIARWLTSVSRIGSEPTLPSFAYATSLAVVSYIGIESISQAAEETKQPGRVIPVATKRAIVAVVLITVGFSLISVTIASPAVIAGAAQAPMVTLVSLIPTFGASLALWVALVGFTACYISTNTGVIGVSRVTFSMGRLGLLPPSLGRLHRRFKTPYITIMLFSTVAILLILGNLFLSGIDLLNLIASLYNFGALVAYMYVNLSLIVLRFKDRTPRQWKLPGNVLVNWKGQRVELPIIPVIGFLSCLLVWLLVVGTHELGRALGAAWFLIGLMFFFVHGRATKKL